MVSGRKHGVNWRLWVCCPGPNWQWPALTCPWLSVCLSIGSSEWKKCLFSGPLNLHLKPILHTASPQECPVWPRNIFNCVASLCDKSRAWCQGQSLALLLSALMTYVRNVNKVNWLVGNAVLIFLCSASLYSLSPGINASRLSVVFVTDRLGLEEVHPLQVTSLLCLVSHSKNYSKIPSYAELKIPYIIR